MTYKVRRLATPRWMTKRKRSTEIEIRSKLTEERMKRKTLTYPLLK